MKALFIIVLSLSVSFYFTDIDADSGFRSVFLPIVDLILFCALALWIAGRTGWQSFSSGSGGGFFDGGDGGGSCD